MWIYSPFGVTESVPSVSVTSVISVALIPLFSVVSDIIILSGAPIVVVSVSADALSGAPIVVVLVSTSVSDVSAVAVFFFVPDNNATFVKDLDKNKSVPMTTAIAVSGNTYAELYAKLYTYIELKPSGANDPNANAPAKKCDTKRTTPAKIPPKRNFTL